MALEGLLACFGRACLCSPGCWTRPCINPVPSLALGISAPAPNCFPHRRSPHLLLTQAFPLICSPPRHYFNVVALQSRCLRTTEPAAGQWGDSPGAPATGATGGDEKEQGKGGQPGDEEDSGRLRRSLSSGARNDGSGGLGGGTGWAVDYLARTERLAKVGAGAGCAARAPMERRLICRYGTHTMLCQTEEPAAHEGWQDAPPSCLRPPPSSPPRPRPTASPPPAAPAGHGGVLTGGGPPAGPCPSPHERHGQQAHARAARHAVLLRLGGAAAGRSAGNEVAGCGVPGGGAPGAALHAFYCVGRHCCTERLSVHACGGLGPGVGHCAVEQGRARAGHVQDRAVPGGLQTPKPLGNFKCASLASCPHVPACCSTAQANHPGACAPQHCRSSTAGRASTTRGGTRPAQLQWPPFTRLTSRCSTPTPARQAGPARPAAGRRRESGGGSDGRNLRQPARLPGNNWVAIWRAV